MSQPPAEARTFRGWHLVCGACCGGEEVLTIGLPKYRSTCELCGKELGDEWYPFTEAQYQRRTSGWADAFALDTPEDPAREPVEP